MMGLKASVFCSSSLFAATHQASTSELNQRHIPGFRRSPVPRYLRLLPLLCLAHALAAQSAKRAIRSDDVHRIRDLHDPQRSPNGKWPAYTASTVDTARARNIFIIWRMTWDGAQRMQLTGQ
jgi:hypothetical protein